jgi:hypothetical protein
MTDNRQIKDGLGNLFTIRMRDFSAAQDGTEQRSMILATAYPVEYGNGGSYHRSSKSNVLAANMAAQAPVYSFQWTSTTMLAVIRRVRMSAWSADTGFVAGLAMFDMTMARVFAGQYHALADHSLERRRLHARSGTGQYRHVGYFGWSQSVHAGFGRAIEPVRANAGRDAAIAGAE